MSSSTKMDTTTGDNPEAAAHQELDLEQTTITLKKGSQEEKIVHEKEDDVSQKEIDLTTQESDKLSGGVKVFREAVNSFSSNPDEDVTTYHVMGKCKTLSCYVGTDEAGRGPVLGPTVYSIFACVAEEDVINEKKKKGLTLSKIEECPPVLLDTDKKFSKLNDSKQLTEKVREEIFKKFSDLDYIAFGLKIISHHKLQIKVIEAMGVIPIDYVSHNAAIELIQGLVDRGVKIERVYVDTVGPMENYQKKLEQMFPDLRFKVDKKADSKYKPVSAASVCAKVTRDIVIKEWKLPQNENANIRSAAGWGSGYPGDPVTKKFLRKNIDPVFGFPNIVRNSWSTASDLLEKCAVKIKWESDQKDEASAPKISKYFGKKSSKGENAEVEVPEISRRKSQFFNYRELQQTGSIF